MSVRKIRALRYRSGVLFTDHKPLVPLINTQDLDRTPLRCQRLLMRMRKFNPIAEHLPGKQLIVPDALSRSPLKSTEDSAVDISTYVDSVVSSLPMSDRKLESIRAATESDSALMEVVNLTRFGWPNSEKSLRADVRMYFASRGDYSVWNVLLMYRGRIVIPEALRPETLEKLHSGHLGLNKCSERANNSVWWPGISADLDRTVKSCDFCREHRPAQKNEPLTSRYKLVLCLTVRGRELPLICASCRVNMI